jgi:hypothetical protein
MEIYYVKSPTCDCKGCWTNVKSNGWNVCMDKPCLNHELKCGNMIYYEIIHLLKHITSKIGVFYKIKYLVKVLELILIDNAKHIKIELKHNGEMDVLNFDETEQFYFTELNNEPMWKKIDDTTIHFIILYQDYHHTIEKEWESE